MQIDIRKTAKDEITEIRVSDSDGSTLGDVLRQYDGDNPVWLWNSEDEEFKEILGIKSEEHAKNLIEGLEKAIELNWFN